MPLSNLKQIQARNDSAIRGSKKTRFKDHASAEERHRMIARAAYFRALARGFEGGHEEEDWYAAEAEIEQASGR